MMKKSNLIVQRLLSQRNIENSLSSSRLDANEGKLGATFVNYTFVGNGVSNNMAQYIATTSVGVATNYQLNTTSSQGCYNCYQVSQAILLNVQNTFGNYY